MEDKELNIVEHLEELRKRIIITAVAFLVFFGIGFVYVEDIYHWFVKGLDVKLIVLGPGDIIWVYLMLASVVGIAGTIPVLALQVWLFVRPALRPVEKRVTLAYIPALFILFILGISFGYFVIFPSILSFLVHLSGDMMATNFTAQKYFSFIINMTLPFGFLFELPVVIMFLTSLGIITPAVLKKLRKLAYMVLVIIATIITPPDFVSETLVALPLLLLYEISVSFSKIVYKRKLRKDREWEQSSVEASETVE
ncbi:twin-arginine translocase subunit TatC [Neobacillus sp. SM06]|uniref:twin-arginine translocase subunit TatC n=1 Tax=Neobacillus sp. SM06 TaxID=3422492 RepID=UPI003D2C0FA2